MKKSGNKESLRSLMTLLGMDPNEGKLPQKWDGSYTHSHYLNSVIDEISDAGHREPAIGVHLLLALPVKSVRVLLTGGGSAAGGTDLRLNSDFNLRLSDYRFEYGNVIRANEEYKTGVTFIITSIKKVIYNFTLDKLRDIATTRNAPDLIDAFADMGVTTNPVLSFSAQKNLLEADFLGCEIAVIKAVIDQVKNVVDSNNPAGNPIPDLELRAFLLEKASQSDDSPDKSKYSHTVNSIEADLLVSPISYNTSLQKLKLASDTYNARSSKGNVVDHTMSRYNDSQKVSETANFTLIVHDNTHDNAKEKCLACGKNHSIERCNSNYPCAAVKEILTKF